MKKKTSVGIFAAMSKISKNFKSSRLIFGAALVVFGLVGASIFWHQISFAERTETNKEKQSPNVWQIAERNAVANRAEGLPDEFQTVRLDKQSLANLLRNAPHESRTPLKDSELVLQFPMPDGTFSRFRVQEAPVLEEGLAARFPDIKSYRILGLDSAATTGRFDFTPRGFHATIISPEEIINILPADANDDSLYASYKSDGHEHADGKTCFVEEKHKINVSTDESVAPQTSVGPTLRTYRIAISTTFEYTSDAQLGGGTVPSTVASINTWLTATNAIYERELSIRMIMVNDTDAIYTANTDPYDDSIGVSNSGVMLDQVRNVLRDQVGVANYNLGHLFARNGGGGVAYLGVICSNSTQGGFGALKGGGVTSLGAPIGNSGSLKVLAHEIGHQFGADHTFNGTLNGCGGGNRSTNGVNSYEAGSGNTIMSYFSICSNDNVVGVSDLRFHSRSHFQMTDHVINGSGNSCVTTSATGNTAPTINAGANFTIPRLTPFTLTATGSDADLGDVNNLTYAWEQYQAGGTLYFQDGTAPTFNDALDTVATTRPIFRAVQTSTNPSRTFPSLEFILNNANDPPDTVGGRQTAEELPRIGRTLNFRSTVRDAAGGVNDAAMTVTVDGATGPFTVVDPVGTWTGGTAQIVTWNVNSTTPLAANVKISLSTDGGNTFPTVLLNSTANDGSESITVPNGIVTSTARVKIEAVGNIFFDISGVNFAVTPGDTCPVITDFSPKAGIVGSSVVITGTGFTGATSVTFNGTSAAFTVNSNTQITATVPAGATGGVIAVNEGGCTAAQTSSNFAVCPSAATTLQIDDDSAESASSIGDITSYFVNRLTPASYPATLSSVTIVYPNFGGFPVNRPVTILSGSNTSGGVNNTTFRTIAATASALGTPVTYNVEPITITSGDFVVGYSIVNAGFFPVGVDTSAPQNGRSYFSSDGSNFSLQSLNRNYLIRAGVFTGACSTGNCTYTISPTTQNIAYTGGTGTVNVTTQAGCVWTASRQNYWISMTSNFHDEFLGTGSGSATFNVAGNNSIARTGTVTVAGQNVVVNQVAAPTAASVSVAGRVSNLAGNGVRGAIVSLLDQNGQTRTTRTNAFGYYNFEEIEAGATIVLSVSAKRFTFAPQVVVVSDSIDKLDFVSLE